MGIIHAGRQDTNTTISNLRENSIQPNAVDLSLRYVYQLANSYCELSEDSKVKRNMIEVIPENDWYVLGAGYYLVEFDHTVHVGEDEAGYVVPRSTLMRNGIIIHSCLYDSGYCGKMIAGMTVNPGCVFKVKRGTRLAQYLCFKSQSDHQYNGQYQNGKL